MTNKLDVVIDELGMAIAGRDINRLRNIYDDKVVVWHSATGQAQTKEENCALLAKLFTISAELGYHSIQRHAIEGGVVQQHCLKGRFNDGTEMPALHACMVIKVEGGKIIRIDEYFDFQTFAPVWEKLLGES
ncbi:MAG: nuclear transport factor 2 family protein [Zhongshania sp.]|uniref:nuclear transport factor 2 family protein n=1 Tax=Zhongshania sp. TaxID=1971902 RepID=UPI00260BC5F0|nr:nuclear transport factor 2 family protein [Zhongshania sp.]MDF1691468.1 nuclear transport factor 2 family protein [Zhongshania sp.]